MPKISKSFSLVPHFQASSFTTDNLEKLLQILRKHDAQEVKFTSTRRLGLVGPSKDDLEEISRELECISSPRKTGWITYIQSCPGEDWCKYGIRDSQALGSRIESIESAQPLRAKVKVGVAGCHMCCTEPYVRDIGIIAERKGWKFIFGGNAGGRARVGDVIAEGLTDDQVIELTRRCLTVYQENAGPKMRTARFMEVYGVEKFIQAVLAQPL